MLVPMNAYEILINIIFNEVVLTETSDLVVEVMRCAESLLAYFGRAHDAEAKVFRGFCSCLCKRNYLLVN